MLRPALCLILPLLVGCTGVPQGIEPVKDFDLNRYLGTWYEIARLDHRFERGLEQVSATYSLRGDGGVRVINRGYNPKSDEWKSAEGRAYFADTPSRGHLKVSFFRPFYGSYIIFELDQENGQYAFVSGANHDYLWLLARTPSVEPELIDYFIKKTSSLGFSAKELIYPKAYTHKDLTH